MQNKLEVRDLRVSFRTVSGKVKAVRGINFDLKEGETLAIVGESGSGKSVTSKAILGILAGNAIVEGGEILYDSKDLLKIPEDEFYKIRGDKIAMIFQDPLSSLNPIMRIGKQLTEAMLLKGKARQKACRTAFNSYLSLLSDNMVSALAANDSAKAAVLKKKCKDFDKFEFKHLELESAYNEAYNNATEAIAEIENLLFLIEKNALKDEKRTLQNLVELALGSVSTYVVSGEDADTLKTSCAQIKKQIAASMKSGNYAEIEQEMHVLDKILRAATEKTMPNFFSMGYYLTFANQPLPELPTEELNKFLRTYLDDNFMLSFIDDARVALELSAKKHDEVKRETVAALKATLEKLSSEATDIEAMDKELEGLIALVKKSIDPMEIVKDSTAYTFKTSLRSALEVYSNGKKKNVGEEKRYAVQKAKYDKLVNQGKTPDWKLTPASLVDMDIARENICKVVTRLLEHYERLLASRESRDFTEETVAVIDFLKANASGVVNRVTRRMAKLRALKLMEEVGIPEPRKRYKQYPFEFSGGMRQRIVIAIALAANPDILICDEPTTALDVTIQAQILELINKLKRERNLSIIFITHDLGVVANMADKIAVMYAGKIVEYGTASDVFYAPAHPYTWALLSSMPDLDTTEKLEAIPGTPPNMIYPPVGDAFADRNKYAMKIDFEQQPPMFKISETHSAATWLLHPDAPHVDPPKIVTDRIARMNKLRGEANNE